MIQRPLLLALLLPGVAHADWQKTRRDMSPAQAQKVTNGQAPDPTHARGWTMGVQPPALVFDYRSGELAFVGTLYFGDGKRGLLIVVLKLANPTADWRALRQRYSEPAGSPPLVTAHLSATQVHAHLSRASVRIGIRIR